jgi:carboxyl-terminal processing protease
MKRMEESKTYKGIMNVPFWLIDESFNTDYDKAPYAKKHCWTYRKMEKAD